MSLSERGLVAYPARTYPFAYHSRRCHGAEQTGPLKSHRHETGGPTGRQAGQAKRRSS